jgi:hypothetical protein
MTRAVADDPSLRRQLGEAGYRTFVEKFTAHPVVDQIIARLRLARDCIDIRIVLACEK